MTLEEVKKGLACCIESCKHCQCADDCPFVDECWGEVEAPLHLPALQAALDVLNAEETDLSTPLRSRSAPVEMTRLLTLEEAQFTTGVGWEEIWFDADEEEGTPEYRECFPCVFINGHYVCEDGDIGEVSPDTYNKPHHSRLWMGREKPSDEAREAEEWDE